MTNNTIPNVSRELTIERDVFGAMHIKLGDFDFIQIQYQYPYTDNASTKALAERIAALLSAPSPANHVEDVRAMVAAPSPAGVDGLEVVLGEDTAFGRKYVRLSEAQAIIDGLRGEVGAQRVKTCIALKERNDAHEERDAALVECERRQMQLAACGVVALANTIESAGEARQMHPDYMSASCSDVAGAVDREIALRTERDQHAQRIGELEGLLQEAYKYPLNHACETVDFTAQDLCERIDAALSADKDSDK